MSSTITASTCHAATTFDTFLSLFDGCPTLADTLEVSVLAANDDDSSCVETNAGASSLLVDVDEAGTYYLALERFAVGSELSSDDLDIYFDLGLSLECELKEVPTFAPTPSVTIPEEEEEECPSTELACGDLVFGSLDILDSVVVYSNETVSFFNTTTVSQNVSANGTFSIVRENETDIVNVTVTTATLFGSTGAVLFRLD